MRYSAKQYSASLISALEGKSDSDQQASIKRFMTMLQRNGDFSKRQLIAREIKKQYLTKEGTKDVVVEVASEVSGMKKELESALGGKILLKEEINPSILGGVKILINEEILIDASVRSRLNKLFTVR